MVGTSAYSLLPRLNEHLTLTVTVGTRFVIAKFNFKVEFSVQTQVHLNLEISCHCWVNDLRVESLHSAADVGKAAVMPIPSLT